MLWFSYQGRFLDVLQLNLKLFILLVGDAIYKIQCRSHYRAHTCREAITNWLIIKKAHSASDNIFAIIATLKRQSKRANIDSTHSDIINSRIHCVKCPYSEFFGPYFPAFGLNTDQKNSEYRHLSRSILKMSLKDTVGEVINKTNQKSEFYRINLDSVAITVIPLI